MNDLSGATKFGSFTLRDNSTVALFVELNTADGNKLQVAPGHFCFVNEELASGGSVLVGNVVELGTGKSGLVISVRVVSNDGIF